MSQPPLDPPFPFSVRRIWDEAQHQGMTDLIRFHGRWYCVFRESDRHVKGTPGIIRIITSGDGSRWHSAAVLAEPTIDLRDPKLSITPDGRLMILLGGSHYAPDGSYLTRQPRVAFSSDGKQWSPLSLILTPNEWLWRLTWHQGKAYGISYRYSNPEKRREEWLLTLFETADGLSYRPLKHFEIPGHPNEATLRFTDEGEMIALVRREKPGDNGCWIGSSFPPYASWEWKPTSMHVGGPNFLILPNQKMLACGRAFFPTTYGWLEKTAFFRMTRETLELAGFLPSGGDTSYPGMVLEGETLWISYYSSHEGKSAIYLAKVEL